MQKTFHIIGAGKVGHTLALLLQQQGWQLAAVVSRSGRALWADCCGGRMVPCIADLPRADVLIISTPDDAIAAAAQEAAALPWLHGGVLALHLSGAKSAAALDALAAPSAFDPPLRGRLRALSARCRSMALGSLPWATIRSSHSM